jgi:serine phosphatase RsbU (regulator of sigma subunit)
MSKLTQLNHTIRYALPPPFTDDAPTTELTATLPIEAHNCALCVAEAKRQVREVNNQLRHEARIAVQLQRALLPATIPQCDDLQIAVAYQAGSSEALVGGDFYDVFEVSAGKMAFVVGDVCGMGLAAAAQVAMLRHMLRYALFNHEAPGPALAELSNIVTEHGLLTDFATVFVAIFDVKARRLEHASCGHQPAMVVRSGNPPRIELLMPTGPLLGPRTGTPIRGETRRLAAGDALIIYTDGLVECGPNRCELLTVARLMRIIRENYQGLTAKQLAERLYVKTRTYSKNGFLDDVCLLVGRFAAS